MNKINIFFFVLCFFNLAIFAQAPIDICENIIPSNWQANNGKLSLSKTHFKQGQQSIRWDWNNRNAAIQITDTTFKKAFSDKRSSFTIWVYNETPVNDSLVFSYGEKLKTDCSFSFQLNFKGWRTAWVMYNRDMKGDPSEKMDRLIIHAPSSVIKGSLFFDAIQYVTTVDPRAPMRDDQVPFINPSTGNTTANAHWVNLLQFSQFPDYLKMSETITAKEIADMETIKNRYEKIILPDNDLKKKQINSITKDFNFYQIKRNGNTISGRPVNSINEYEINHTVPLAQAKDYAQEYGAQNASNLLFKIAVAYRSAGISAAQKDILSNQFFDFLDHLHDQGWAYGSGMGSVHHLGYNFRNYFSACLLMKEVLKNNNRLERTIKDMYWFSGQGRTHQLPKLLPSSNIDVFNTLLGGMLATILMMDDSPQKVLQLQEFTEWLSNNIGPEYSIEGTFKPGGSVTHHGTLYPAYAIDGLKGLTPIIYTISNTSFSVTPKAFGVVRKSLMMMHRYTNPLYWPLSVSGRHPGEGKIAADPYAYMALAGGKKLFDTTMAAIYLQILGGNYDTPFAKEFIAEGIKPSRFSQGHWDMNYGLLSIHRRANWLLTVRGHNRYFVSHESYPGANMYGRYLTYGNLELFYPNDSENKGSYFKDEGWDWNNIPGTTTLEVPLDKLRANIINADDFSGVEEMLLTDKIFAGGTHLDNQGIYGMKLHGNDKYDMGSFRANKSWFMFDSLVVCLGSDITNTIKDYPTVTTLFQNYLSDNAAPVLINDKSVTNFPYEQNWKFATNLTVIDNRKTGYYIPDAENVIFTKAVQNSRNQQDTKDTKGDFAKLIIDHGKAPSGLTYEYALLINTDSSKMKQFVSTMTSANPAFKVLQQDSIAHIVYYGSQKITGCV
ncbi:MAG: chondroitinase family polysaccharide lyase, partial [Ginsengibacter sp.]